jgi:RNA polymerase sigma-70 factor, ECF subfamily
MYPAACAAAASVRGRSPLDEESREWLRCLAVLAERERALARLYQLLLRAARAELRRRSLPVILEGQQQDDLAHQADDDALLAITSKPDRFRRESRFAPWADKFVMLEVSAKLGRHYWRNPPVPMSGDA